MEKFLETYRKLNDSNLHILSEIYTKNVIFMDPAHEIHGLENLRNYFASLYANINTATFTFSDTLRNDNQAYIQWIIEFSHPKLAKGEIISFPGATSLKFNDEEKVIHHQDYFDLGAMLYEHLPLFGRAVKSIKKRLGT